MIFGYFERWSNRLQVTLDLKPEIEKGLLARAREQGVTLAVYLQEMAAREVEVREITDPTQPQTSTAIRHISDVIIERMSKVPAEIMEAAPTDGASQHDHYLYGTPKREE